MATTDYFIRPEDGWTLVATAPTYCQIKPGNYHPWWVAVAASTPAASHIGMPFGADPQNHREGFELPATTAANVYIRVQTPLAREPDTQEAHFCVLVP